MQVETTSSIVIKYFCEIGVEVGFDGFLFVSREVADINIDSISLKMVAGLGSSGGCVASRVTVTAGIFSDITITELRQDTADRGQDCFEFRLEVVEVAGVLREVDLRYASAENGGRERPELCFGFFPVDGAIFVFTGFVDFVSSFIVDVFGYFFVELK